MPVVVTSSALKNGTSGGGIFPLLGLDSIMILVLLNPSGSSITVKSELNYINLKVELGG
jgi:hypothetical protein